MSNAPASATAAPAVARQRTAAVLEVLGIYVAGPVVSEQLTRLLGFTPTNPLVHLDAAITNTELVVASGQLLVLLLLQYAGWFLLAIPVGWWHRRRGAKSYGFTRAGHSWTALAIAGLATAALCLWPTLAIDLAGTLHPFGETTPWRQALFDMSWRRWQFWLLTAVMSWGLVAAVEEIFFRGYCQRRLAEDWGDGPAIAGVTCLFVFAHTQYLALNGYNALKLPSLVLVAFGCGVVFAWTRSLMPSVIAHVISNVPMTSWWETAVVALLMVGTVVVARKGAAVVRQVFREAALADCVALAAVGASYAIAAGQGGRMRVIAPMMVLVAIGLEALNRAGERRASTPAAGV